MWESLKQALTGPETAFDKALHSSAQRVTDAFRGQEAMWIQGGAQRWGLSDPGPGPASSAGHSFVTLITSPSSRSLGILSHKLGDRMKLLQGLLWPVDDITWPG